jgi:hypothetical protein
MKITQLPNHCLELVSPEIRKTLGKAGLTASECREVALARSEKELQGQLQNLLLLNNVKFPIRNRMDKRPTVAVGTPDILFVLAGIPCAWEVKMPGQKPRADQEKAMNEMQADGWRCAVIHSVDEGMQFLRWASESLK